MGEPASGSMTEERAIATIQTIASDFLPEDNSITGLAILIGTAFDSGHAEQDRRRFSNTIKYLVDKQISRNDKTDKFILCIDPNFTQKNITKTLDQPYYEYPPERRLKIDYVSSDSSDYLFYLSFSYVDSNSTESLDFIYHVYFLRYALQTNYRTNPSTIDIALGTENAKTFQDFVRECRYDIPEGEEINPEYLATIGRSQVQARSITNVYKALYEFAMNPMFQSVYCISTFHAHTDLMPTKVAGRYYSYGYKYKKRNANHFTVARSVPVDARYLQNLCEIHRFLYTVSLSKPMYYINLTNEISVFKDPTTPVTTVPSAVQIDANSQLNRNEGKQIKYHELLYEGNNPFNQPMNVLYKTRGGKRKQTRKRKQSGRRPTRQKKK